MSAGETAEHLITVYRYRLKEPLDWGRDCEDEMFRMTKFWNALVEIERGHRAAVVALTSADPAVAELESRAPAPAAPTLAVQPPRCCKRDVGAVSDREEGYQNGQAFKRTRRSR